MAPMPAFMPISSRIGPFTTTMAEAELEVLPRAETCEAASARMTGKYSGLAPAMTAFTATCSTVYSHATRNLTGCRWPTISSPAWLVCASIAATRFSVGSTIGSLSVQSFSRNNRCRFSSVSGSSRRGPVVSNNDMPDTSHARTGGVERTRERRDDFLHEGMAADGVLALHIGLELRR